MIIFFPDTVRAESLSPYAHPFVSTPNAARLASEGVLFEQATVGVAIVGLDGIVVKVNPALQDMLVAAWPPRGGAGEGNLDRLLESTDVRSAAR
jgi:hypothetical protein